LFLLFFTANSSDVHKQLRTFIRAKSVVRGVRLPGR
jgi:hypothetical protein